MSDRRNLGKLALLLSKFREDDPHLGVVQALALVTIADDPGLPQVTLAKAIGLSRSAAQRICEKLIDPLGWVEYRPGDDARERRAYPTDKGRRVLADIDRILSL